MAIETTVEALDFPALVRPGSMVCWGQASAEPLTLTRALMAQRSAIGRFDAFVGIGWSETADPAFADYVRFYSYCATGTNRRLAAAGCLQIVPSHYAALSRLLAPRVDVLMLQLALPDAEGRYGMATACEYLRPLVDSARLVIAEINDQAPATPGPHGLIEADIDIIVHSSRPLATAPPSPPGAAEKAIGAIVAGLVEDGAVLQIGLGSLPDSILQTLGGHRDLGVHSGLMTDSMAALIERGVITNARKASDAGISVAGLLAGGRRLTDLAHRNPAFSLRETAYTHGLHVLAGIERLTAINAAVEVDLTGQINAEEIAGRYVGAVGGAADFLRGAHLAVRGRPIIALPATARDPSGPVSRIVAKLGGPVSTARADAGIIVTEHGYADLRGLSLPERRARMIALAAPEFREELTRGSE
ncbi:acetyl-CoA hydrolase/transferase C-terminal domain-containing protein [Bosea sp. (in: a-proteobacteria)]|uniref:acetyl-CoA hydrolase/transferase family protein n=1 Tax=Bosea sp. (in: a-proteobacteria) TaxID=1871050 RepID=UPI00334035E3